MAVDKMSVSLAPSLSSAVRDAAEESGETLSGWLANAALAKLRSGALDEFLAAWESENGAITDEELSDAVARLAPVAPAPSGWFNFVKLTASPGSHQDLISMVARVIESGRPVLIPEPDASDLSRMVRPDEHISFERAEVRVELRAE